MSIKTFIETLEKIKNEKGIKYFETGGSNPGIEVYKGIKVSAYKTPNYIDWSILGVNEDYSFYIRQWSDNLYNEAKENEDIIVQLENIGLVDDITDMFVWVLYSTLAHREYNFTPRVEAIFSSKPNISDLINVKTKSWNIDEERANEILNGNCCYFTLECMNVIKVIGE